MPAAKNRDRLQREVPVGELTPVFERPKDSTRRKWDFLFKTLINFGFGTDFVEWVSLCYHDIYSAVSNAGFNSSWFKLKQGVRQGCPLSCLIFLMVVEVLAQQIRNSKHIEGIKIGNVEHKVTQFADDTTCTLRNEISVSYLLDLIKHFTLHD